MHKILQKNVVTKCKKNPNLVLFFTVHLNTQMRLKIIDKWIYDKIFLTVFSCPLN